MFKKLVAASSAGILIVGASVFAAVLPAQAATLTITSTVDGAAGSLRSVLAQAQSGDVIEIPEGWDIPLTQGQLQVAGTLTIRGAGGARPSVHSILPQNPVALIRVAPGAGLTLEGINFGGTQPQNIGIQSWFGAGALTIRDADFVGFTRSIAVEDANFPVLIERVKVTGGDIGLGLGAIQPGRDRKSVV